MMGRMNSSAAGTDYEFFAHCYDITFCINHSELRDSSIEHLHKIVTENCEPFMTINVSTYSTQAKYELPSCIMDWLGVAHPSEMFMNKHPTKMGCPGASSVQTKAPCTAIEPRMEKSEMSLDGDHLENRARAIDHPRLFLALWGSIARTRFAIRGLAVLWYNCRHRGVC